MSAIPAAQPYYLRSKSDKPTSTSSTASTVSTASPTSPLNSTSPPMPIDSEPSSMTLSRGRKSRRIKSRKRKFSQIEQDSSHSSDDDHQDIDLNIDSISNTNNKRPKLSKTVKFTLQPNAKQPASLTTATATATASDNTDNNKPPQTETQRKPKRIRLTFNNKPKPKKQKIPCTPSQNDVKVISREASLKPTSPLLSKTRRRYPRIEEFEIPTSNRLTRRNPYVCCYEFFSGYKLGITSTLGARIDVKQAIKILSQDLVSQRAKASIQTTKNTFLVYIKTRKNKMIACSIVHVDRLMKRVIIDMFAVDESWRGNGFASMMVYLIQYRMIYYAGYDLFVCAATSAVPFWSNKKYNFVIADKRLLEQHELNGQRKGDTKQLIWYGTTIQARCALLQCFVQTE